MRTSTPGSGGPTVPIRISSGRLTVAGRGGLGEAVALEDRDADAAEEVAEAGAERGAAGDGVLHLAAHRRAQLAVDELVEDGVAHAAGRTGRSPASCASDHATAAAAAPAKILPLPPASALASAEL